MAVNEFNTTDYFSTAKSRVTEQFRDKEVFEKYLRLMVEWQDQLQGTFKDLKQLRSLDTASGYQLDVLGDIVGQPRQIAARDYNRIFSPDDEEVKIPVLLDDEQYRLFIKVRIMKNITDTTPESIIESFNFLFGTDQVILTNVGRATIRIDVAKEFTAFELAVLEYAKREKNLLPIAVGVGFDIGVYQEVEYFAFDGFPNARGFGSLVPAPVGYDGTSAYDGEHTYDSGRVLAKTPVVYGNTLDGSFDLDGSEALDGGDIISGGETIGGFLSSILNID